MNVNNFFKFIGDKFPKYRMTSDNEEMRVMFHKQYEKDIMNHERDGEEVLSAYMGVPGEQMERTVNLYNMVLRRRYSVIQMVNVKLIIDTHHMKRILKMT
jgi:hypothetical protein